MLTSVGDVIMFVDWLQGTERDFVHVLTFLLHFTYK